MSKQDGVKRTGSSMSNSTHMSGNQSAQGGNQLPSSSGKNSSTGSNKDLKTASNGNQTSCLGHSANNKDPRKKISECISITYKDFKKLMGPKSSTEIPGLAVDFIKVMTLDMIDLHNFEKTMGHYRDTGSFTGTLVKIKTAPSSPNVSKLDQTTREKDGLST